jgi:hypothetical protein
VQIYNTTELDSAEVCAAARRVRARLRQPPLDVAVYLAALERSGLPGTAGSLHVPDPVIARLACGRLRDASRKAEDRGVVSILQKADVRR